ncbi:hypothetical protein PMAYCL1PPCAC_14771, partial [Pristionchus mayeri]
IVNGFFSVDSFFFISGVLLAFLWFKTFHRRPSETMSGKGWAMFYVHRFLRLSPAFYILVIFYTFVFKQLIRDTPLSINAIVVADECSESWWVELLYLHNFVNDKIPCLGYSWYLDADMQMFLFTPLLLIPLALKPLLGFIVAAVIISISTATNIFLVYYYHWPESLNILHPVDPDQTNIENYPMLMYASPLIRCQVYIIGMLVGRFLQTRKQLKLHLIVYFTAWIIAISLMLTVLFGLHNQTTGTPLHIFWRAMYSAFSRPAWALGLSAVVILCYYGYGGPTNTFMSWNVWVPLGRLSYSGYLIHIPVIHFILAQTTDEVYFTTFLELVIARLVPITTITYVLAIFWSAFFELSFARIERLLLVEVRCPKTEDEVDLLATEEMEDPGNGEGDPEEGTIVTHQIEHE